MKELEIISVIVPVYNTAEYLQRCIDSIIGQTYSNLEILLINDGSTDDSGNICEENAKTDSRIRVLHQENKGQSVARNAGLETAMGQYFTFVDSDDWIDLDMYATMMNVMRANNLEIVECNEVHRYEDTESKPVDPGKIVIEDRITALKRVIADQSFSVCKRIYHRNLLSGMKFLEATFAEDVYFSVDVMCTIDKIAVLSNPFYNYYKANESTTRGAFKIRTLGTIDAALYVESKIKKVSDDPDFKPIIDKFILTHLLYNYRSLHLYPDVDSDMQHRKKIKKQIGSYVKGSYMNSKLFLAHYLPVRLFNFVSQANKSLRGR